VARRDDALRPLGLTPARLTALRRLMPTLHAWYGEQARDLPWRRTRDPYAIWLSEVMLQQTQVATVLPYYERWMRALPEVAALAAAQSEQLLQLWEGLGYYSRALNMHRAARRVVEELGGELPRSAAGLRELPGVGAYTAAAVASIAFDEPAAVVDGNVRRVLARLVALEQDVRAAPWPAALQALADRLLSKASASTHNQAMMELGALVCTPRAPRCDGCPLAGSCRGRRSGTPERFPAPPARRAVPHQDVAIGIVLRDGRCLIDRRPEGALLGGLWEFPGGKLEEGETAEQALRRELREELGLEVAVLRALPAVDHAYSHLRVTLHPFLCRFRRWQGGNTRAAEDDSVRWVVPEALAGHAMPRANRKVLALLDGERLADIG
jgi:A/G-specific adenine glycosylase